MGRYLVSTQAKTRLSLGKPIAQFLLPKEGDEVILRWVSIDSGEEKAYCVAYHEVFDEGEEDFTDIVEFTTALDENGEEVDSITTEFDTIEEALTFANTEYGALADKYVAESMIGSEYADYLKSSE
ncbi:hypothetical protein [Hymenobacter fodinae]|uniref:Uncharacterized protein n=1 Tax=Hymenobacter fodinae TaxID=2510796 RepID=A0A4Z0P9T5_9BACT|nr:hypothetical protein [Hymenobacter fodinae]TGE09437.1 hypothetical protein EU556_00970 [Hymenobacter fodinae]